MARPDVLHVTNGDTVVAAVSREAGVKYDDVVVWRDVLHDGPVPERLDPGELAAVRAAHLARRGWVDPQLAITQFEARDRALAQHPPMAEVVLWFEEDLYDALQLAQIDDRLAERPGPVKRIVLPHEADAGLAAPLAAARPHRPAGAAFAALRSPDPREWERFEQFARLCEELPDSRTGLSRLEREILETLAAANDRVSADDLFTAVSVLEQPPWIGDWPLWALADELAPLLVLRKKGFASHVFYEILDEGRRVLAGEARREVPDRWVGGVHLGPARVAWAWDSRAQRVATMEPGA